MPRKKKEVIVEEPVVDPLAERRAELHALHATLVREGIRSISDLENKIALVNRGLSA